MSVDRLKWRSRWALFLISFLTLYFELIVIRWLSSEVRVFAYLKNLPLIASFLGMGLGCACARTRKSYFRFFPLFAGALCLVIAFSQHLGITFLPFPIGDYLIVGDVAGGFDFSTLRNKLMALGKFLAAVFLIFGLCVAAFFSLGQRLGQLLEGFPALQAYTINIAGSLLGVASFSLISFAGFPPLAWFSIGFGALLALVPNKRWAGACFALTLLAIWAVPGKALWSPYYRIDITPLHADERDPLSALVGYNLNVNHDYHQRMLDLSDGSVETEATRQARSYYNLIYRFVRPERVLVVGAGSGNDVASALRHGASHVDAVEIDPLILKLGQQLHPERPYSSPRVRVVNNDARAFFRQSRGKYDLIVFGLLDSQTLLSSMSSIRLDNYIYTLESIQEARSHLKSGGVVSLSFALTESWIQERFFRMLREVFGQDPVCLQTPYDAGISYVAGSPEVLDSIRSEQEIQHWLIGDKIPQTNIPLPTDDWPFLYLKENSIPFAYSFTLSALFLASLFWIRWALRTSQPRSSSPAAEGGEGQGARNLLMFLLGAGFMLIEVKSISDLSLLFGSTWFVNSVVIASILVMILFANAIVIRWSPKSMGWVYAGLLASLMVSYFFKPDALAGLDFRFKALIGGFFCSLPIFFAGILFASSFRQVSDIPRAFGANLIGALAGGLLENLSMIYGVASLNLFAIGIYCLSAVSLYRPEWLRWRTLRATSPASGAG